MGDSTKRCPCNRQWSKLAALSSSDGRAHLAERFDDPSHRTTPDRGVTGEDGEKILSGQQTGQQADARARVTAINDASGLRESPKAFPMDVELIVCFVDSHSEGLQRAHGIETIFSTAIVFERALAFGQRSENERTVGDGFVAGNGNRPTKRLSRCDR